MTPRTKAGHREGVARKTCATRKAELPTSGVKTRESEWAAWAGLDAIAPLDVGSLREAFGRIVVVAPHPSDDLLGCGGLLSMLAECAMPIALVFVTDGEASHSERPGRSSADLASLRRSESRDGLLRLGLADAPEIRLGFPDGRVIDHERAVAHVLSRLLRSTDLLLSTWVFDGHSDHEAVGRAAAAASIASSAALAQMPVYMWLWAVPADPRVPWKDLRVVALTPAARDRKRAALAAHQSQLQPFEGSSAIIPPDALSRSDRSAEYFFLNVAIP